jgi:hypothetical protein
VESQDVGKICRAGKQLHGASFVSCYCAIVLLSDATIGTSILIITIVERVSLHWQCPSPPIPSTPSSSSFLSPAQPPATNTSTSTTTTTNDTMVTTRRSLGGATPVPSSSPPTAPSTQLSRAQQAALKKLDIAGTDALKGDARAAQAAKDQVETYHYRGAVYAADANTPASWLENQPKRYLKRSRGDSAGAESRGEDSIAVGEEEGDGEEDEDEDEDEDDTPARPAKRRRSDMPLSREKSRAGRGGSRSSLPTKKKAEKAGGPRGNTNTNNNTAATATISAIPTSKSPLPNQEAMEEEIRLRRQEAKKKNYNVEQLDSRDIMVGARSQLVKLANKQKKLKALMLEWNQAKELLEAKKSEAGANLLEQVEAEPQDAPEPTNFQPTMEIDQSDDDDDDDPHGNSDELHQQWQREQEQNRLDQQALEIPETSPAAQELQVSDTPPAAAHQLDSPDTSPDTQQPKERLPADPQPEITHNPTSDLPLPTTEFLPEASATIAGASRPQTPTPAASPENNNPSKPLPSAAAAHTTPAATTDSNNRARASNSTSKEPSTTPFSNLPVDSALPTTAADGSVVRWTLKRRSSNVDPDFEIDLKKYQGESKSARRRRVERERSVALSWAAITGGRVFEEN